MDTATAAQQANVTPKTIRVWCRQGRVNAVKTGGRWVIDADSLTAHLATRTRAPKPVVFSVETMVGIGGSEWQRGDKHRVYLNDWSDFTPLKVTRYNTGNISSATWNDEEISNAEAGRILGAVDKVWFDVADGQLHCRYGYSQPRSLTHEEIWQAITAGIRAAIAAL